VELYYYALKVVLFASIVRALVVSEALHRYTLWMGAIYTAVVALLSYVFLVAPQASPNWTLWQYWLGLNLLLSTAYFKLLVRFEDGVLFWVILPFAAVVVLNEPNLIPMWMRVLRGGA
jgi:hypothetical protein